SMLRTIKQKKKKFNPESYTATPLAFKKVRAGQKPVTKSRTVKMSTKNMEDVQK
ncbi:5237_t:CDS:1, partial [Gigaspora rosea]